MRSATIALLSVLLAGPPAAQSAVPAAWRDAVQAASPGSAATGPAGTDATGAATAAAADQKAATDILGLPRPGPGFHAPHLTDIRQLGIASWYGRAHRGKLTANGEHFQPRAATAAHKWLPFGTLVRVTNLANGRTVQVRINDRGPYKPGRIIDLSAHTAALLGMRHDGISFVQLTVVAADQTPAVRAQLAAQAQGSRPGVIVEAER